MFAVALDSSHELAQALLTHYSFDLGGYSPSELIARWQNQYPLNWLHLAIIEALYQGRYKAISVQQILVLWQRREQATFHFNVEFENLVCSRFPEIFTVRPNISKQTSLKNNTNVRQQNHLSPVSVAENNSKSPTTNKSQINSKEEEKNQEHTEEIPSFLHLARRHRQPIVENTDNKINSSRNHPHTESNSPLIEKSISNLKDKSLLSTVSQSALAVAAATYTALENSHRVAPVSTLLAEKQLSHLETLKINHPPIDQFIPENSDRSNSFTSKLKAISTHKVTDGENGE